MYHAVGTAGDERQVETRANGGVIPRRGSAEHVERPSAPGWTCFTPLGPQAWASV
jgi:hypothetical protein